jgi:3-deoxy-D-manno-octulosonate 8-phosphate phosphatase KdsC-like HAD superfamily phosphatase
MTEKYHIVTDCDGIFTSANIFCTEDGKRGKLFSVNDSLTVEFIQQKYGHIIDMVVLTGDSGQGLEVTKRRLDYMELDFVNVKNDTKYGYIKATYPDLNKVFYIGDDIYDFLIMSEVYGCTVNNAPQIVKNRANYVSPYEGGKNALTDILFHILNFLCIDYEQDLKNHILEKQKQYVKPN